MVGPSRGETEAGKQNEVLILRKSIMISIIVYIYFTFVYLHILSYIFSID